MGSESSHCNYFNYFTEIEEHFQRARGSGLFLLSPVDWALIEGWKNSGVPLEAVLSAAPAIWAPPTAAAAVAAAMVRC